MKRKLITPHRIKILAACIMGGIAALYLGSYVVTYFLAGKNSKPEVMSYTRANLKTLPAQAKASGKTIRVMTQNLAHGRGKNANNYLQKPESIKANLKIVANVIDREAPQIVAFEEADESAFWTGDFNQVKFIAKTAGFKYSVQGKHVNSKEFAYGTGIISEFPLTDPVSVAFKPTPPTFCKGFVMATTEWPGRNDFKFTVVALHLDFSRISAREQQVEELVKWLRKRGGPMIIMGDFNSAWSKNGSAVRLMTEKLNLQAYRPEAKDLATFRMSGARLDWILISKEFEFKDYHVIPDKVSDHQGVIAKIAIKEN